MHDTTKHDRGKITAGPAAPPAQLCGHVSTKQRGGGSRLPVAIVRSWAGVRLRSGTGSRCRPGQRSCRALRPTGCSSSLAGTSVPLGSTKNAEPRISICRRRNWLPPLAMAAASAFTAATTSSSRWLCTRHGECAAVRSWAAEAQACQQHSTGCIQRCLHLECRPPLASHWQSQAQQVASTAQPALHIPPHPSHLTRCTSILLSGAQGEGWPGGQGPNSSSLPSSHSSLPDSSDSVKVWRHSHHPGCSQARQPQVQQLCISDHLLAVSAQAGKVDLEAAVVEQLRRVVGQSERGHWRHGHVVYACRTGCMHRDATVHCSWEPAVQCVPRPPCICAAQQVTACTAFRSAPALR